MKTKLMILALIGVLLAGAMVFVSCDGGGCSGNGKCAGGTSMTDVDESTFKGFCYYSTDDAAMAKKMLDCLDIKSDGSAKCGC